MSGGSVVCRNPWRERTRSQGLSPGASGPHGLRPRLRPQGPTGPGMGPMGPIPTAPLKSGAEVLQWYAHSSRFRVFPFAQHFPRFQRWAPWAARLSLMGPFNGPHGPHLMGPITMGPTAVMFVIVLVSVHTSHMTHQKYCSLIG